MSAPERLYDSRGNVWERKSDGGVGFLVALLLVAVLHLAVIRFGVVILINVALLFLATAPVVAVYCVALLVPMRRYLRLRERRLRVGGGPLRIWRARLLLAAVALLALVPWLFVNLYVVPEFLHLTRYRSLDGTLAPLTEGGYALATIAHTFLAALVMMRALRIRPRLQAALDHHEARGSGRAAAERRRAYESAKRAADRMAAARAAGVASSPRPAEAGPPAADGPPRDDPPGPRLSRIS